ncbi:glycosyltransferase family 9 protein [Croceitalea sp. MTPC9]|uniref:glycosyltransferase family 9 protein n=1 Tax=unclassified Croceitalea TaxID=2632280 RepID=UPI002B3C88F3|nr:glycosyltransferase family 9 protein [Croceitalea sp. MTPC6]GMN15153.1 glycosyltransferase family 9 protein [Croceitalea sp. MTPC9]
MRKFLVIQQKMIGDVLASTILCEHLKIHFPDSEVHFLINENTTAVVDGNPYIDKTVIFRNNFKKDKSKFYQFLKSVKKENYDVVIDVYCKLESNLISYFSKASIKISYKKWYSKFIYDHLFTYSQNPGTKLGLAIENRLLLLSPIIDKLKKPELAPKIFLSSEEIAKAKDLLKQHKIGASEKLLMIGVLGSSPIKSYPLEYLAKTIDYITEKNDVTLLFNYIPSQKVEVDKLLYLCSEKSRNSIKENLFCPSLRDFLALLSICDAYIGNEGGATNMSKALDIPNFSIFSPWISKTAWLTFNENTANRAVHLADYLQNNLIQITKKERKKNSLELYQLFKPEYFKEELLDFINTEVFPNQ